MGTGSDDMAIDSDNGVVRESSTRSIRIFSWTLVAITFVYLINNYLTVWLEWPGAFPFLHWIGIGIANAKPLEGAQFSQAGLQFCLYLIGFGAAVLFVLRSADRTLRADSAVLAQTTNYIIRSAFWAVVLIGCADALVSFLRVENFLETFVGADLTSELGRSRFRAPVLHFPLLILAMVIGARTRTLGFHWLALLVVAAEFLIVISRFVFSYEQAFQGDLVRFWYGALFLFASAYTLFDDGHVRVDILYASFTSRAKGRVNAVGSLVLGISLCWTIMIFGMWDKTSIVNAAILSYEVSQSGYGMYVKFWMAGFLAIFAVSMMIQFISYLLESIADYREEPGRREPTSSGAP